LTVQGCSKRTASDLETNPSVLDDFRTGLPRQADHRAIGIGIEEVFEMWRFFRNSATRAALVLVAIGAAGVSARADFIATATQLGFPPIGPTTLATGSPSAPGGLVYAPGGTRVFNDFSLTGVSLSEVQTAALSEVLSSALTITNTGSVPNTIIFQIQATGFTSPLAPPGVHLVSSVGGTTPSVGSGAPNALSFASQAGGAPPAPTLSPSITGQGVAYSASTSQDLSTGVSAPYTVFQTYFITLNPGATLQFTGRTDLTPEPSSVVLTLVGLPLIGLFCARRMRRR
jgi:hypothetical protein